MAHSETADSGYVRRICFGLVLYPRKSVSRKERSSTKLHNRYKSYVSVFLVSRTKRSRILEIEDTVSDRSFGFRIRSELSGHKSTSKHANEVIG